MNEPNLERAYRPGPPPPSPRWRTASRALQLVAITLVVRWFVGLVGWALGLHGYEMTLSQAYGWFMASRMIGFCNVVLSSFSIAIAATMYRGAPRELRTRRAATATAVFASLLALLPIGVAIATARAAAHANFSPTAFAGIAAIETSLATSLHIGFTFVSANLIARTNDSLARPPPRRLTLLIIATIVLTLFGRVGFIESILRALFGTTALWTLFLLHTFAGGLVVYGWARIFRDTARLVGAQTAPEPAI